MFKWLFGKKEVQEVQEQQVNKMSEYELEKAIHSFNEQILENCNILQKAQLSYECHKRRYKYILNKYDSFRKKKEHKQELIKPLESIINDLKQANTYSMDLLKAYALDTTDIEIQIKTLWDTMVSIEELIDEVEDLLYNVQ